MVNTHGCCLACQPQIHQLLWVTLRCPQRHDQPAPWGTQHQADTRAGRASAARAEQLHLGLRHGHRHTAPRDSIHQLVTPRASQHQPLSSTSGALGPTSMATAPAPPVGRAFPVA